MSRRETQSEAGMFGFIKSYQTDMNISQLRWDLINHKNPDEGVCQGNLRPSGCLVCDHDVEACNIENCQLCAKRNGTYGNEDFSAQE